MVQKCASPSVILAYVGSERATDRRERGKCHGIEVRCEVCEKLGRELEQGRIGSMLGKSWRGVFWVVSAASVFLWRFVSFYRHELGGASKGADVLRLRPRRGRSVTVISDWQLVYVSSAS